MFIERFKQIQFRVLFNLYADIVKLLDRCVAGQEVQRSRSEADDLQVIQSDHGSCDRLEFMDHVRTLLSGSHRILRDIGFHIAQFQIVAGIEHAAVRIAAALYEIILCFFRSRHEHLRSLEMFCKQGLGDLRPEVSKVDNQCIASGFLNVLEGLYHMDLTFYDADRTFIDGSFAVLCCVSVDQCFSPVYGQALRETVAAYRNNSDLQFWHVVHDVFLLFHESEIICYGSVMDSFYIVTFSPFSPQNAPSILASSWAISHLFTAVRRRFSPLSAAANGRSSFVPFGRMITQRKPPSFALHGA